jgi:hypothetical protein
MCVPVAVSALAAVLRWLRATVIALWPHQVRQAETQGQAADGSVTAGLPYQWLFGAGAGQSAGADYVAGDPSFGRRRACNAGEQKLRSNESLVTARGCSRTVVRTVTENSRSLKFTNQGFEEE